MYYYVFPYQKNDVVLDESLLCGEYLFDSLARPENDEKKMREERALVGRLKNSANDK